MILTYTLLAIAGVIVALILIVALQPGEFRIARSAVMAAQPADVFGHVNDLHKWDAWSPWAQIDPGMKQTYAGAAAGTGALYEWSGNDKVGQGRMTITESKPAEHVRIKLEFMKPFTATNSAEFTFKPDGSQTVVTWTMTGKKNFMFKAIHMIMNMDKMLGGQFEKGLTQLKAVVEQGPKQ